VSPSALTAVLGICFTSFVPTPAGATSHRHIKQIAPPRGLAAGPAAGL